MPAKTSKKKSSIVTAFTNRIAGIANISADNKKNKDDRKPVSIKLIKLLAVVYLLIWIVIGILVLIFIYANARQGAFRGLFSKPQAAPQSQVQAPTETNLPGVGRVNIACVQNSLSTDAIQKLVQNGNTSTLTDDEKAKLEPCITQKEVAAPSASPSPNQ